MKQCKTCGSQCDDSAVFCGNCNSSLDVTFDPARQPENPSSLDQTYSAFSTQTPPQQPQQPIPPPQQYSQPPQEYPPQQPQQYPPPPPQQYSQPPQQYPQQPQQQQYQQNPYQYQHGQPQPPHQPGFHHKYSKLGGWLLVFVIANICGAVFNVFTLFGGIFETLELFSELPSIQAFLPDNFQAALTITLIGEVVGLLMIVCTIMFVVGVFSRKSNFLRFHQIGLFVNAFYTIFVGIIPNAMLEMFDQDFASNIGTLVGLAVGFFLFALYMSKSIRVRTYMGSDEYMDKAIFAFKNQPPLQPPPGQY